jgi:hypothetical protein
LDIGVLRTGLTIRLEALKGLKSVYRNRRIEITGSDEDTPAGVILMKEWLTTSRLPDG